MDNSIQSIHPPIHFLTLHHLSSFPTLSLLTLHPYQDTYKPLLSTLNYPREPCFALDQGGLLAGSVPKPKPSSARTHTHLCISPRPSYQPDRTSSGTPRSPGVSSRASVLFSPRPRRGVATLFCYSSSG